ncbi:hypothetical protein [Mesorhizobium sp. Cs1321R2N1]|uniref:hypothetical protein n=1 Tax=Mesorhizobium sp. Cs1321R2N1 TaxID=3015174 RepID=UPI00301BF12F
MRIKDRRASGEYYHSGHVHALVHGYETKIEKYKSENNLWDACYCRGYQNGLLFLLSDEYEVSPPIVDLIFDEAVDTTPKIVRFSRKKIPKLVSCEIEKIFFQLGSDLIPEHMPYV